MLHRNKSFRLYKSTPLDLVRVKHQVFVQQGRSNMLSSILFATNELSFKSTHKQDRLKQLWSVMFVCSDVSCAISSFMNTSHSMILRGQMCTVNSSNQWNVPFKSALLMLNSLSQSLKTGKHQIINPPNRLYMHFTYCTSPLKAKTNGSFTKTICPKTEGERLASFACYYFRTAH